MKIKVFICDKKTCILCQQKFRRIYSCSSCSCFICPSCHLTNLENNYKKCPQCQVEVSNYPLIRDIYLRQSSFP